METTPQKYNHNEHSSWQYSLNAATSACAGGVFPSIYLLFYIEGHQLFEIEGK